ncbi:endolytic transglycosylase MltG [Candidatus Parcubacteria bacterium]|nr:endolytic transglycosylase MltG [Candidatus Parcubacteria bacterium]
MSKKRARQTKRKYVLMFLIIAVVTMAGVALYVLKFKPAYNIARSYIRFVYIPEGLRREQIANQFATALGWTNKEKEKLLGIDEGYLFPGIYVVSANAGPSDISKKLNDAFIKNVIDKQENLKNKTVDVDTIMKIASIIQREAAGPQDMEVISGIIWNRLFQGMNLDIDATLQYVKGNEETWWPGVNPEDKSLDSPYNTYKNVGLPPSPISNPGEAAINAALNPAQTKALFYIHDRNRKIHTAETYEQHKRNIQRYY